MSVHRDTAAMFERERPRLLAVAFRILGSHAGADDIVQNASVGSHRFTARPRPQVPPAGREGLRAGRAGVVEDLVDRPLVIGMGAVLAACTGRGEDHPHQTLPRPQGQRLRDAVRVGALADLARPEADSLHRHVARQRQVAPAAGRRPVGAMGIRSPGWRPIRRTLGTVATPGRPELAALGLAPGERVRWRDRRRGRWREGTVVERERDGSVGVRDGKGASRSLTVDRLEVCTRGPRGARTWEPLTARAARTEQLALFAATPALDEDRRRWSRSATHPTWHKTRSETGRLTAGKPPIPEASGTVLVARSLLPKSRIWGRGSTIHPQSSPSNFEVGLAG